MGGKVAADGLVDGHGLVVRGDYSGVIGLADAGKNVLIYLVDGCRVKAQVASPIDIVQCICHKSLYSFRGLGLLIIT